MLLLWYLGLHYEKIAKGLDNYRLVFGPSPLKMAYIEMGDCISCFVILFIEFILAATLVLLSIRSPKLYSS
jgi:hypothetical protein